MKTLFIGSVVEDSIFNEIITSSKKNKPSIAGQRFERLIVEGMDLTEDEVEILSYMPISAFPDNRLFLDSARNSKYLSMKLTYIPLVNINVLKQLITMTYTLYFLFKWCIKHKKTQKNILLNVVYVPTALPSLLLAKVFNIPVVVVIPDVSKYRFSYTRQNKKIQNFVAILNRFISEKFDKMFDGYIFLTKEMNQLINKKNKPFIVIEGMISPSELNVFPEYSEEKKIIMYAGSLREKYGISKLLSAVLNLKKFNVEFWIFGAGDYEKQIKKISLENEKIKFFGLKSQEEVYKYEQLADLLVNPRPSNEKFTLYSFPSKTLEYMSSGTPVLTTKLPGIPQEYFEYLLTFEDESVKGMEDKLIEILSHNRVYLQNLGASARAFVLENKNYIVQTQKINHFLKNMDVK